MQTKREIVTSALVVVIVLIGLNEAIAATSYTLPSYFNSSSHVIVYNGSFESYSSGSTRFHGWNGSPSTAWTPSTQNLVGFQSARGYRSAGGEVYIYQDLFDLARSILANWMIEFSFWFSATTTLAKARVEWSDDAGHHDVSTDYMEPSSCSEHPWTQVSVRAQLIGVPSQLRVYIYGRSLDLDHPTNLLVDEAHMRLVGETSVGSGYGRAGLAFIVYRTNPPRTDIAVTISGYALSSYRIYSIEFKVELLPLVNPFRLTTRTPQNGRRDLGVSALGQSNNLNRQILIEDPTGARKEAIGGTDYSIRFSWFYGWLYGSASDISVRKAVSRHGISWDIWRGVSWEYWRYGGVALRITGTITWGRVTTYRSAWGIFYYLEPVGVTTLAMVINAPSY